MDDYVSIVAKNTELFSNSDPDSLFNTILDYADERGCKDYVISSGKYKLKLPVLTTKD